MEDGDIFISTAGKSESVSGADKCVQDIAEALMTPLDSARDYGSELADLNIPEPVSVFAGKAIISRKIDEAIQRLKRLQELDPHAGSDERIDRINRLIVDRLNSTDFTFWVSVFLKDDSISTENMLAVSLRHQESAQFAETIQELVRRKLGEIQ